MFLIGLRLTGDGAYSLRLSASANNLNLPLKRRLKRKRQLNQAKLRNRQRLNTRNVASVNLVHQFAPKTYRPPTLSQHLMMDAKRRR